MEAFHRKQQIKILFFEICKVPWKALKIAFWFVVKHW